MKFLCLSLTAILLSGSAFAEGPKPPDADRVHIRNVADKNVLRPRNAEGADGIPIVLYPVTDWKCVTWKMTPAKDGNCTLKNYFTGKSFAADAQGAVIQVPAGKGAEWKFTPVGKDRWRILAADGKRCLGFAQGKVVMQDIKDNDESQLWEVLPGPEKFSM